MAASMGLAQGQDLGSRRVRRRPLLTRRPGTVKTFRRRVVAVAVSGLGPARRPTALPRIWAITVSASQTALAMKWPEGRCARPALWSSAMRCSTIACQRWVGLEIEELPFPVGDERAVVPGGEQRELAAGGGTYSPDDQPDGHRVLAAERGVVGLGDVGAETSGVESQYGIGCHAASSMASMAARIFLSCRTVTENATLNFTAVSSTALLKNALSARTVSCPVAPALRSRLTVSERNDLAPRADPAAPPRSRLKITIPVCAQVANCGW
jgi:hypothetical protein